MLTSEVAPQVLLLCILSPVAQRISSPHAEPLTFCYLQEHHRPRNLYEKPVKRTGQPADGLLANISAISGIGIGRRVCIFCTARSTQPSSSGACQMQRKAVFDSIFDVSRATLHLDESHGATASSATGTTAALATRLDSDTHSSMHLAAAILLKQPSGPAAGLQCR